MFIPCAHLSYPQARSLAEIICELVAQQVPDIATTNVTIEHRGSKLFVDPSQNDYADTLASAYSVRPYKHPMVSTPLSWKEIKDNLDPDKFTMDSVPERLKKKGDLFGGILDKKVSEMNTVNLKKFFK
jgi:bifunctional non-homologous end joining protein LigD